MSFASFGGINVAALTTLSFETNWPPRCVSSDTFQWAALQKIMFRMMEFVTDQNLGNRTACRPQTVLLQQVLCAEAISFLILVCSDILSVFHNYVFLRCMTVTVSYKSSTSQVLTSLTGLYSDVVNGEWLQTSHSEVQLLSSMMHHGSVTSWI